METLDEQALLLRCQRGDRSAFAPIVLRYVRPATAFALGRTGRIHEYTKLLAESREQALDRMLEQARMLHADAVICVRFTTSMIANQASEILAYGTAVRLSDSGWS